MVTVTCSQQVKGFLSYLPFAVFADSVRYQPAARILRCAVPAAPTTTPAPEKDCIRIYHICIKDSYASFYDIVVEYDARAFISVSLKSFFNKP